MIAVISDIHGNEEALNAVQRALDDLSVEKIVCLGDVVGYGASPQACVDRLRRWQYEGRLTACCLGNHDAAVLDPRVANAFNPVAASAIAWTRHALDEKGIRFLSRCSLRCDHEVFSAVHACWTHPRQWVYLTGPSQMAAQACAFDQPWGFFGHTHIAGGVLLHSEGRWRRLDIKQEVVLHPNEKAVLNPGAVGQPRDGDTRASFMIFDDKNGRARWCRVVYDIDSAAQKILDAGLPVMLAERLRAGW